MIQCFLANPVLANPAGFSREVDLFTLMFFNCFVPETKQRLSELGQEKKAILFLDNCSAHPSEDELVSADGKITAKFLPPYVTSLVQSMDQGVLESIKRVYRKSILRDLVSQSTFSIKNISKRIDIIKTDIRNKKLIEETFTMCIF